MLVKGLLCSSFETNPFNEPRYQNLFSGHYWLSHGEAYQMFHKFPKNYERSFSNTSGKDLDEQSMTNKTLGNAQTFRVYRRRDPIVKPRSICTEDSPVKSKGKGDELNHSIVIENECEVTKKSDDRFDKCRVYSRRKWRLKSAGTTEAKRNDDQLHDSLVYDQKKLRLTMDETFTDHSNMKRGDCANDFVMYSRKKRRAKSKDTLTEHVKDQISVVSSLPARHESSVEESISGLALLSTECSSGTMEAENITKDMVAEDLSVSVHRTDGSWPDSTNSHVQETHIVSGNSSSRRCDICDPSRAVENMRRCEKCEGGFHTCCCGDRMKEILESNECRLCSSCLEKKQKILKKVNNKKRVRAKRVKKWKNSPTRNEVDLILRDVERYKTRVRIGKKFQAKVPAWLGPITSETSLIGEPLEINQSEYIHHFNINSARTLSSIGNWLQCREEDTNGEICGKWRRAPLFEVQTDEWECYSCISWDPSRADCAVPQELETSEILKQLKYIETLRPQLDTKRRKLIGLNANSRQ